MRTLFAVLTSLLVVPLVAAPIPKSLKKKRNNLDGTWLVESISIGGSNSYNPINQLWIIEGDLLKFDDKTQQSGRIDRLIPVDDASSIAIDWDIADPGGTKSLYRGIIEIEGDTWRFCFSTSANTGERPTTIAQGPNVYLYTFKRQDSK